jgi:hypothetical protein
MDTTNNFRDDMYNEFCKELISTEDSGFSFFKIDESESVTSDDGYVSVLNVIFHDNESMLRAIMFLVPSVREETISNNCLYRLEFDFPGGAVKVWGLVCAVEDEYAKNYYSDNEDLCNGVDGDILPFIGNNTNKCQYFKQPVSSIANAFKLFNDSETKFASADKYFMFLHDSAVAATQVNYGDVTFSIDEVYEDWIAVSCSNPVALLAYCATMQTRLRIQKKNNEVDLSVNSSMDINIDKQEMTEYVSICAIIPWERQNKDDF